MTNNISKADMPDKTDMSDKAITPDKADIPDKAITPDKTDMPDKTDTIKKVSVIIPVYNVERYIDKCLEMLLCQTYKNIEILLIDDGSSDNSGKICDKYMEEHDNIRTFHIEQGLCAARNTGLCEASGDYIVFVDSDDYVYSEETIYIMVNELEKTGADIVAGNYSRLWNEKLLPAREHAHFSKNPPESEKFKFGAFYSIGTMSYLWGKMYRRSFLEENEIHFENFIYAEDKAFSVMCYLCGAVYAYVDEAVYVYRKNDDSISYRFKENTIENWMAVSEYLALHCEDAKRPGDHRDIVAFTIFFGCFFDGKMFYENKGKKIRVVKQVLKKYASYPLAAYYFKKIAGFWWITKIGGGLWPVMLWGFSLGMSLHMYSFIGVGIKFLVEMKIDQRLSDTGRRE